MVTTPSPVEMIMVGILISINNKSMPATSVTSIIHGPVVLQFIYKDLLPGSFRVIIFTHQQHIGVIKEVSPCVYHRKRISTGT